MFEGVSLNSISRLDVDVISREDCSIAIQIEMKRALGVDGQTLSHTFTLICIEFNDYMSPTLLSAKNPAVHFLILSASKSKRRRFSSSR